MSYGEPLDSPGKTKELTRQHEALKKALQEREKRYVMSETLRPATFITAIATGHQ